MRRPTAGFTIVELLIVIVVIGILAAVTVTAYNGTQTRARDAKRVSDMAALAKALEQQRAVKEQYPNSGGCLSAPHWNCWGFTDATRFIDKEFMPAMPQDPTYNDDGMACGYPNSDGSRAYWYQSTTNGNGYILGTHMETVTTSDPHYDDGSVNRGCGNFINWAIKRNWPN